MMDQLPPDQKALFHEFRLENHTPQDHLLRQINPLPDLGAHHEHLAAFYTPAGRPSVNPEVIIYMLIAACCYGDRSQRRLCEKVDLNPACRWFCRAGLEGKVPDHCTFSGNRYGRFRESDTFRQQFGVVLDAAQPKDLWATAAGPALYADSTNYRVDTARGVILDTAVAGKWPMVRPIKTSRKYFS